MTPAEQQLVENLFERMRQLGPVDADEARQELAADDAALDDMQDAMDDGGSDWGGDGG